MFKNLKKKAELQPIQFLVKRNMSRDVFRSIGKKRYEFEYVWFLESLLSVAFKLFGGFFPYTTQISNSIDYFSRKIEN